MSKFNNNFLQNILEGGNSTEKDVNVMTQDEYEKLVTDNEQLEEEMDQIKNDMDDKRQQLLTISQSWISTAAATINEYFALDEDYKRIKSQYDSNKLKINEYKKNNKMGNDDAADDDAADHEEMIKLQNQLAECEKELASLKIQNAPYQRQQHHQSHQSQNQFNNVAPNINHQQSQNRFPSSIATQKPSSIATQKPSSIATQNPSTNKLASITSRGSKPMRK